MVLGWLSGSRLWTKIQWTSHSKILRPFFCFLLKNYYKNVWNPLDDVTRFNDGTTGLACSTPQTSITANASVSFFHSWDERNRSVYKSLGSSINDVTCWIYLHMTALSVALSFIFCTKVLPTSLSPLGIVIYGQCPLVRLLDWCFQIADRYRKNIEIFWGAL